MRHQIIYWQMAKRETDVDDTELAALYELEGRGEAYIEFIDGNRLTHTWDNRTHRWRAMAHDLDVAAA